MRNITVGDLVLPALGQGGWNLGTDASNAEQESTALRLGLELGMRLFDTAEMYGGGQSERFIGTALQGVPRSEYLLASKVLPYNAGRPNIFASCDATLKNLQTEYLDLYLLHWREETFPLAETVECMEELVRAGKIKRWGVSNFDVADLEDLWRIPGGSNCAVDQVVYHLGSRGIEYDLIPWAKEHGVALMAYSPLAQIGELKRMNEQLKASTLLQALTRKYEISLAQLLLAFVLRQDNVMAIPKAGSPKHLAENAAAAEITLSDEDWAEIDVVFCSPASKVKLGTE